MVSWLPLFLCWFSLLSLLSLFPNSLLVLVAASCVVPIIRRCWRVVVLLFELSVARESNMSSLLYQLLLLNFFQTSISDVQARYSLVSITV